MPLTGRRILCNMRRYEAYVSPPSETRQERSSPMMKRTLLTLSAPVTIVLLVLSGLSTQSAFASQTSHTRGVDHTARQTSSVRSRSHSTSPDRRVARRLHATKLDSSSDSSSTLASAVSTTGNQPSFDDSYAGYNVTQSGIVVFLVDNQQAFQQALALRLTTSQLQAVSFSNRGAQ